MILRPFEYVESKTVDEAVAALRSGGEDARVIAGGTALVPLMKHSVLRPERHERGPTRDDPGVLAAAPERGHRIVHRLALDVLERAQDHPSSLARSAR